MSQDGSRTNQLASLSTSISGFGRLAECLLHVSSCSLWLESRGQSLDGLAKAAVFFPRTKMALSPELLEGVLFWPVSFSFPFRPFPKHKTFLWFFHNLQHPVL